MPPRALILCPLEVEARRVRAVAGDRAEVIVGGLGARSAQTLREFVARHGRPERVILAGVCGGLLPSPNQGRHEGFAVRIERVVSLSGERWDCPIVWATASAPREATLVGVDAFIPTSGEKRALSEQTGAAWVDMESHHFARTCEELGLPWGVARGVSDDAERDLPPWLIRSLRADGSTRVGYAAIQTLLRPWQLPALLHVVRTTSAAADAAGRAALEMFAQATGARTGARGAVPVGRAPVSPEAKVVLVVGGTFDPPHIGHVALPREAARAIGADWRLYIPAARSPHKPDGPVASDEDRLEMLRRALAGEGAVSIATIELERGAAGAGAQEGVAPSYTIDTLRELREALGPGPRLRLFLGADQAAEFHRWKDARGVIALAEPVVALRAPFETAEALLCAMAAHWSEGEIERWRKRILPAPLVHASATAARAGALAEAPGEVARFIRERGLYGAGGGARTSGSTLSP